MARQSAYGFIWPLVSTYEDWNTPSEIISTHFRSGSKRGAQNFGTPISTITEPFLPLISTPKKATQFTHFMFLALYSRFFLRMKCCSLKIFRLELVRQKCMTLQIWKERKIFEIIEKMPILKIRSFKIKRKPRYIYKLQFLWFEWKSLAWQFEPSNIP